MGWPLKLVAAAAALAVLACAACTTTNHGPQTTATAPAPGSEARSGSATGGPPTDRGPSSISELQRQGYARLLAAQKLPLRRAAGDLDLGQSDETALVIECGKLAQNSIADAASRERALSVCLRATATEEGRTMRAIAYSRLSFVLSLTGRDDEAVAAAQGAVNQDRSYGAAHFALATALTNIGRHADALGEYQDAVRLAPSVGWYHMGYAAALGRLGRWDDAVREGRDARRLGSDDTTIKTVMDAMLREIERAAASARR